MQQGDRNRVESDESPGMDDGIDLCINGSAREFGAKRNWRALERFCLHGISGDRITCLEDELMERTL